MTKKQAARKKKRSQPSPNKRSTPPSPRHSNALQEAAENRTAVAATVGWMLSLMSTISAEAIGLFCRWYTILVEPVDLLTVLSSVMLFVALISGTVTLLMIPVVLRVAKTPPPRPVVQVAMVAGCLPLIVVVAQYLSSR